jgi:hypothetical protein
MTVCPSNSFALRLLVLTHIHFLGPVSATIVHPSGMIVGTCSGQRHVSPETDEELEKADDGTETLLPSPPSHYAEQTFDNTLKVWKI